MKINISKGLIIMLLLPTFILIMFILEIIYAKEIFDKFLTLGVIAFLFQLGLKIGSIDEKVKGLSNKLDDRVRGLSNRLDNVEKKVSVNPVN